MLNSFYQNCHRLLNQIHEIFNNYSSFSCLQDIFAFIKTWNIRFSAKILVILATDKIYRTFLLDMSVVDPVMTDISLIYCTFCTSKQGNLKFHKLLLTFHFKPPHLILNCFSTVQYCYTVAMMAACLLLEMSMLGFMVVL